MTKTGQRAALLAACATFVGCLALRLGGRRASLLTPLSEADAVFLRTQGIRPE